MYTNEKMLPILRYIKNNKPENNINKLLDLLGRGDDLFSRHTRYGHFTSSAFIVSEDMTKVLLIRHLKHQKWLLPGGHVEDGENTLEAAIREAEEEVGLKYIKLLHSEIIDLDIHKIPENTKKNEPEHWHFDTRYLFSVISDTNLIGLNKEEATDFQWIRISAILKNEDSHLYEIAKKAQDIIQNIQKG